MATGRGTPTSPLPGGVPPARVQFQHTAPLSVLPQLLVRPANGDRLAHTGDEPPALVHQPKATVPRVSPPPVMFR
jgi:hypothetical protein